MGKTFSTYGKNLKVFFTYTEYLQVNKTLIAAQKERRTKERNVLVKEKPTANEREERIDRDFTDNT